jgi:hypothetical protein
MADAVLGTLALFTGSRVHVTIAALGFLATDRAGVVAVALVRIAASENVAFLAVDAVDVAVSADG